MRFRFPCGRALASAALAALAAASAGPATAAPAPSPAAVVGRAMFFDTALSASGKLACSSCHDPSHAHAAPNGLAVQFGGSRHTRTGVRAVPSLRYQEYTPPYADLFDNPDGISAPGPGGGYTGDGRAATLAEQAKIPLMSPLEMANKSPAAVVRRIRHSGYAEQFRQAFGPHVFDDVPRAYEQAAQALQAYQLEDSAFHPFDSKYDRYAGNKIGGAFTPAEARGFAVYNDPKKGNCFACHYNGAGVNGSVRLFTDYTFSAIGVPRNAEIAANHDPSYFDLGLCGRVDHPRPASHAYCGMFKTPTLRNVATRQVFFHNGKMKSLAEVIRFYNTRDTQPERWYPVVDGRVRKFDDLPRRYRANIDAQMPLDGRAPGSPPAMSEQDMADLETFLNTLTDGYQPDAKPSVEPAPTPDARPDLTAIADQLARYLAVHGDVCLGKFDWPVEVTERDVRFELRDAVQMPVLERLGLVGSALGTAVRRSDDVDETVAVKRYALTPAGRAFYLDRPAPAAAPGAAAPPPRADLCAGMISLDQVKDFSVSSPTPDALQVDVSYTYRFAPAPWMADAQARQVFPVVAHVMQGQGTLRMRQGFRIDHGHWTPVVPGDS